MKKLVAAALAVLACGAVQALPIGNPSEASLFLNGVWCDSYCCDPCDPCFSWCDAWSVRLGFYGDYVFNRHMELDDDENTAGLGNDIDDTEIFTNAGYVALNFCDRVDVFATIGASQIWIKTDATAWGNAASLITELATDTYFSWSVGGRITVWECDCFAFGVEGQYFQTKPDLDYVIEYDTGTITYFNGNRPDPRYSEWQVGIGASYRFATSCPTFAMVPYLGVKWARSKWDLNAVQLTTPAGPFTFNDLESKKLWGYAVGMTMTLCDMVGVNVEARFADEKAVSVLGQFRF